MRKFEGIKIRDKFIQDIQDRIFKKMPASKKLKLASDFSMFLLKLNKLNDRRLSKTAFKNRKDFGTA